MGFYDVANRVKLEHLIAIFEEKNLTRAHCICHALPVDTKYPLEPILGPTMHAKSRPKWCEIGPEAA